MLALKLLLVPAFIVLVTLAGKRWGPRFAGWIAGLPVVAGPILAIIALEQGTQFAGAVAASAVLAVVVTVVFCLAYAQVCVRAGWPVALLLAWTVWGLAAFALQAAVAMAPAWWTLGASLVVTLTTLVVGPHLFPKVQAPAVGRAVTRVDLALRMLAGAALTVFVTTLAQRLGAAWSGVLTLFPVMSVVLAVFSHRQQGAEFAVLMLRSLVSGLYSLVAFCATLAVGWSALGGGVAGADAGGVAGAHVVATGAPSVLPVLLMAVAMALAAQLASRWLLTRLHLWVH